MRKPVDKVDVLEVPALDALDASALPADGAENETGAKPELRKPVGAALAAIGAKPLLAAGAEAFDCAEKGEIPPAASVVSSVEKPLDLKAVEPVVRCCGAA